MRTNDPVTKFQHLLEERGVLAAGQADQLTAEINEQIETALQWALAQRAPGPEQVFQYVYPSYTGAGLRPPSKSPGGCKGSAVPFAGAWGCPNSFSKRWGVWP